MPGRTLERILVMARRGIRCMGLAQGRHNRLPSGG